MPVRSGRDNSGNRSGKGDSQSIRLAELGRRHGEEQRGDQLSLKAKTDGAGKRAEARFPLLARKRGMVKGLVQTKRVDNKESVGGRRAKKCEWREKERERKRRRRSSRGRG